MPQEPSARAYLQGRVDAAIAELRRTSPEALADLLEAQAALAGLLNFRESQQQEYSGFRTAIEAVEAYLRKEGPTELKTIARSITDLGYGRNNEMGRTGKRKTRDPYWDVVDNIKYHARKQLRLIEKDGLICLPES